ncbi:phosphodiesterase [Haematococcus lacustris]|uniref:Phosphodiesterase n=1 Tax=Haematococcus lacustris TaxID=44745 RepID=A0A699Z479_HAELA|nr:phosphodiesterase [Haematococcus lacustris]
MGCCCAAGTLHVIMTRGGILKAMGAAQEVALLSVYFSAVVHDYQHKGLNNDFLCKTGDELALRYNDRSPMENHHVAAAFELMLDPAVNIFSDTSKKAREVLRKFAIELILATDMKQHFAHNTLFKTKTPALLACAKAQPEKRASLSGAGTKQMAELSAVANAVVAASSFRARVSKAATGDHVVVAKEQSHDGRQAHMEVTGHRQSMRPSLTQIGPDSLLVQSSGDSTPVLEPHEQLQLEIQDDELRILVLQGVASGSGAGASRLDGAEVCGPRPPGPQQGRAPALGDVAGGGAVPAGRPRAGVGTSGVCVDGQDQGWHHQEPGRLLLHRGGAPAASLCLCRWWYAACLGASVGGLAGMAPGTAKAGAAFARSAMVLLLLAALSLQQRYVWRMPCNNDDDGMHWVVTVYLHFMECMEKLRHTKHARAHICIAAAFCTWSARGRVRGAKKSCGENVTEF